MIKNLILWTVIGVILMSVFQSFNSDSEAKSGVDYTAFVSDVGNNQVTEARFDDSQITVTKSNGDKYQTVMPIYDAKILDDLIQKNVKVSGTPPEKRGLFSQILISWFPMLLLIGVW
ncbi:ATP-dependent metalloprotease, partial [Pasteurellaceae bacterium Phil11]